MDYSSLDSLSLEDLMNINITTVSKKTESASGAPAAVFVLTAEDIRRSGATSIPEALRLVPGVFVSRIDSNKWAVTARGFNDRLANKLLVLIDGRSVYTPLFSGVYWEIHDVVLEDIERIEVIRGPGATLWGANAVNGVINIITKSAKDTQGGLVSAGGGVEETGFGTFRYGGKLGEDAFYRFYLKYFNRDDFTDQIGGHEGDDEWDLLRGGFRVDWEIDEDDSLMVQADGYGGSMGAEFTFPVPYEPYWSYIPHNDKVQGADFLTRWTRTLSDDSDLSMQFYYDYSDRDHYLLHERRDILDWEFQHRFQVGERQEWVWGLGYRLNTDEIENIPQFQFDPASQTDHLFSGFLQDEIVLDPDHWRLILGTKLEHNDFSGVEIQPNARLVWTPNEYNTFWTAVSRAVRTPSRSAVDISRFEFSRVDANEPVFQSPFPIILNVMGRKDFQSEELIAYELGYRTLVQEWFSFDAALFYHDYDNIRVGVPGNTFAFINGDMPYIELDSFLNNDMNGEAYGAEIAAGIDVTDRWTWKAAYTLSFVELHYEKAFPLKNFLEMEETVTPRHQISLLSSMDLTKNVELDVWLRYVDELPMPNISEFLPAGRVPAYFDLDIRLGWHPRENLEISLVGQNLLDSSRPEIRDTALWLSNPTDIERSFYAKVTWRF